MAHETYRAPIIYMNIRMLEHGGRKALEPLFRRFILLISASADFKSVKLCEITDKNEQ